MKTVRLGVIGLGARGTFIIRTPLLPLAESGKIEIAAVCEKNLTSIAKGDLSSVYDCPVSVYDACGYSIDFFTAPVVAPSVASFGVVLSEGKITVNGSFDIRVIEGNVGASVMSDLREFIEDPVLILI